MMRHTAIEIFGWYGISAILAGYVSVSFSVLSRESVAYQLLNLTGALGIIIDSLSHRATKAAVLSVIWAAMALIALVRAIF